MAAIRIFDIQTRAFRRPMVYRERRDPLLAFSDEELIERYRFPGRRIQEIVELVRGDVERPSFRNHALSAETQVFVLGTFCLNINRGTFTFVYLFTYVFINNLDLPLHTEVNIDGATIDVIFEERKVDQNME